MKPVLLWDLDGTLTDPRAGITRCLQHALRESGRAVPSEDELLWCIGPPLHLSFMKICGDISVEEAWRLVALYRERFSTTGLFENEVYSGIPPLLSKLDHRKKFVATSKPHHFAKKIVDHFSLEGHFHKIYGSELDGSRTDKGELIQYLLAEEKLAPADCFMIGDRKHDILGAKKASVISIGITWGYGSHAELEEAGADHIFDEPKELGDFLA